MTGPNYSDQRLEAVTTEIEELLGDLMGIEMAAKYVIDSWALAREHPEENYGPPCNATVLLRAREPFTVYPTLPGSYSESPYEQWINEAYEGGKAQAGGTGAWLLYLADGYYMVDTKAMLDGATRQADLCLHNGTALDQDFGDVSANLSVAWDGGAKHDFFEWFPMVYGVSGALFLYADAAQHCVGVCAGAIAAAQAALLEQAERARDTLKTAVKGWHDDSRNFPMPPGTGWSFQEIGTAIQGKVHELAEKIPGPDVIIDAVADKLVSKAVEKIPGSSEVIGAYNVLCLLMPEPKDVKPQPTAKHVIDALETRMKAIAKEGDDSIKILDDKMTSLAAEVEGADILILDRLPRHPSGHYDADSLLT